MDKQDQITSLVWLLIGLSITIGSISSLRIGTTREPGPGLFPLLAGFLVSFFSLAILIKATFSKTSEKRNLRKLWDGLNWRGVVYTIGALLTYSSLLEVVGFLLTTLLLLIYLFRAIKPQKWRLAIGLSFLLSIVSYLVFDRFLQVQLPRGFWGF